MSSVRIRSAPPKKPRIFRGFLLGGGCQQGAEKRSEVTRYSIQTDTTTDTKFAPRVAAPGSERSRLWTGSQSARAVLHLSKTSNGPQAAKLLRGPFSFVLESRASSARLTRSLCREILQKNAKPPSQKISAKPVISVTLPREAFWQRAFKGDSSLSPPVTLCHPSVTPLRVAV